MGRPCGEELIRSNAAIYNASITKKYLLEQKLDFLTTQRALQTSVYRRFVGIYSVKCL